MKGQGARFLMRALGLLVLVSLVLAMVGCGGGGGGGNKGAIDLMKKLPQGTESFMFVNMKTMRNDADLKDMYRSLSDESGGMAVSVTGLSADDVDSFAMAGEMAVVIQGRFDLAKVRDTLKDDGYDKGEYQGVELWKTFGFATALVDSSCVIWASEDDVEGCIDVIKGKSKSLYEKSGVKDDLDKLPGGGLAVGWGTGGETFFSDDPYPGLEAMAISMSKKNKDTIQATAIMRFKDSASAKDALADIETDMKEDTDTKVTNVKVTQDGKYAKATAEMELGASLFG